MLRAESMITSGYGKIEDTYGAAVGARPQSRRRLRQVIGDVSLNENDTTHHAAHSVISYPGIQKQKKQKKKNKKILIISIKSIP